MKKIVVALAVILSGCSHIVVSTPVQYRQYEEKQNEVNYMIEKYCGSEKCANNLKSLPYYKVANLFNNNKIYANTSDKPNATCLATRQLVLNTWIDSCFQNSNNDVNLAKYENKTSDKHISKKRFIEKVTLSDGRIAKPQNREFKHYTRWTHNQCLISYATSYVNAISDCMDNSNNNLTEIADEMLTDEIVKTGLIKNSFAIDDDKPMNVSKGINKISKIGNKYVKEEYEEKLLLDNKTLYIAHVYRNYKGDAITKIIPRYNGNKVDEVLFHDNPYNGSDDELGNHLEEETAKDVGRVADMVGKAVIKEKTGLWWL